MMKIRRFINDKEYNTILEFILMQAHRNDDAKRQDESHHIASDLAQQQHVRQRHRDSQSKQNTKYQYDFCRLPSVTAPKRHVTHCRQHNKLTSKKTIRS